MMVDGLDRQVQPLGEFDVGERRRRAGATPRPGARSGPPGWPASPSAGARAPAEYGLASRRSRRTFAATGVGAESVENVQRTRGDAQGSPLSTSASAASYGIERRWNSSAAASCAPSRSNRYGSATPTTSTRSPSRRSQTANSPRDHSRPGDWPVGQQFAALRMIRSSDDACRPGEARRSPPQRAACVSARRSRRAELPCVVKIVRSLCPAGAAPPTRG